MNNRQAKIIAQLLTASSNANADFISYMDELDEAEKEKVGNALADLGWNFLERHGFTNAPSITAIIAYAKSKY